MNSQRRHRTAELAFIGLLMVVAAFVRLHGITNQGLRFYDEATYLRFGATLLLGDGPEIFYKPGTAMLMALAFKLLGHSPAAAMTFNALVGTATVALMYLLARRLAGTFAALAAAAACAVMPYMLFYHRSAMTEANYFFLALLSLCLMVLGLERTRTGRKNAIWAAILFVLCGVCGGFGFRVNAPAALIWALVVLGGVVQLYFNAVRIRDLAVMLAGCVVGFIYGSVLPKFVCAGYEPASSDVAPLDRLAAALQFSPRLYWLWYLFVYCGPLVLVLAGVGAWRLWAGRHRHRWLLTILAAGLFAFYVQTSKNWPRMYFPLVLPAVLLAGPGAAYLVERFGRTAPRRWMTAAILCCAMLCHGAWQSWPVMQLRSGYAQAGRFLAEDTMQRMITVHGWVIFSVVTPGGLDPEKIRIDTQAGVLARSFMPGTALGPEESFQWFADNYGATHIVLDYFFWKMLSPGARERFAEFVKIHPPDAIIPNPVAGHYPTVAEDGDTSILSDPNARFIYIWRVGRARR